MVGGETAHEEAHKDAKGIEEEDQVDEGQGGGEDDFARTQVKAAELRSSMQTEVSLMYSNVTFTRVFLSDKDIMKGFKVGHFVDQLLKSLVDKVVEQCEQSKEQAGGDAEDAEEDVDLVESSMRASASVLKQSMADMGLDADEQLPLSFGSTAKGSRTKPKAKEDAVQPLVYSAPMPVSHDDSGLGLAVGDLCDCYFDEDGKWYPARVERLSPHHAFVCYLGYDEVKKVPLSWIAAASRDTRKYVASLAEGGKGAKSKHVRFGEEGEEEEVEGQAEVHVMADGRKGNGVDNGGVEGSVDHVEQSSALVPGGKGGKKRRRPNGGSSHPFSRHYQDKSPLPDVPDKYWSQRFRLLSLFDRGCRLDAEGWYSVTPERIAQHIAERSRCDVIVDLFVGCGGNAIQFALTCHHVIAVDIDPVRLACARHNARIYGVEDRIEFILGDALLLLPRFKDRVDVIFISPPWGGPAYLDAPVYDVDGIDLMGVKGRELMRRALEVTPHVAALLPRNVDVRQLAELSQGSIPCEIEENLLNYKVKTTTVYYGGLFLPPVQLGGTGGGGQSNQNQSQQKKKKKNNKRKKQKQQA